MFLRMTRHLFDTPAAVAEGTPPASTNLFSTPPAASAGTPPATPAATPPAGGSAPPTSSSWITSLPKELQDNPSITKFTSVEALAGSYINAQKLIGADKIAVPTKHTTPEEFRQVLHKLGLPEKPEDYSNGVKFKDVIKDDNFKKAFTAEAYKHGILPAQAQAMADFYATQSEEAVTKLNASAKQSYDDNVKALKTEWGSAFDLNINRGMKVLSDFGGKEFVEHFDKSGYGADKEMVKFVAKIGEEMFKEHKFVDGQGTSTGMTPQEIDQKIAAVYANPAYSDKLHPSHKTLVAEAKNLFEMKFPVDKK